MLAACRAFFAARGVIEVDCPLVTSAPSVDLHIDLFRVTGASKEVRYLHTSPEYAMKRLLAEGCGDIYQLGHVFRDEELGKRHNPEFTMAEWYRLDLSFEEMIVETADFARLFLGALPLQTLTYRDALIRFASIDPHDASSKQIVQRLVESGEEISPALLQSDRDTLLQLLLTLVVEPHFASLGLLALTHYPASQAALARTCTVDGFVCAERFELYYQGVELANGYHELVDASEQRARFEQANRDRLLAGKEALPIDTLFLQALEQGLPDCCGVAVGFDRLMMLRRKSSSLSEVLPFYWDTI